MTKLWPKMKFGDILISRRERIKLVYGTSYKRITAKLGGLGIVLRDEVDGSAIKSEVQYVARAGQFIISKIDARNGASGLIPKHLDKSVVSGNFLTFDCNPDRLLPKYMEYYAARPTFWDICAKISEGTTNRVPVRVEQFMELTIDLPPLAEQRRIVARIEELATQIHEAQVLRQQASAEVEAIWISAINAVAIQATIACGGKLTALNDASALVTDGAHNTPRYVDIGVPLLTAKNIFWNGIDTSNVRHISREEHEPIFRRCPVKQGDVLFINIGVTTGTACKVNFEMEFSLKNAAMIRTNPAVLNADFLVYLLRGPAIRDQIAARQAQTCQPFLALRDIRSLNLPIPPISEQRIIVAELDALQAEVDRLKALQTKTAAELDALLPSILDRAFKGEL